MASAKFDGFGAGGGGAWGAEGYESGGVRVGEDLGGEGSMRGVQFGDWQWDLNYRLKRNIPYADVFRSSHQVWRSRRLRRVAVWRG